MTRQFDFNVWVQKWARQYKVPPVPVIVTDLDDPDIDGKMDWKNERILVSRTMVEYAQKSSAALQVVKHIVAHEFGHYLIHRRAGVTRDDDIEDVKRKLRDIGITPVGVACNEANEIALAITGIRWSQVMDLMDHFIPDDPDLYGRRYKVNARDIDRN